MPLLARPGRPVHLFSRYPFALSEPGVHVHAVGSCDDGDVVAQAREYTARASNAFAQELPVGRDVAVIAYEWTAAGVLSLLRGLRNQQGVLSLHSLERQRTDKHIVAEDRVATRTTIDHAVARKRIAVADNVRHERHERQADGAVAAA